jgi:NTE family protein
MGERASIGRLRRRRVGLALSSGVARGWAHIGVIRALTRLGVPFDIVAGCSAGALVGGCHLAQQLDQLEKWAVSLSRSRVVRYLDLSFGRGGLIKGERIKKELRKFLGQLRIEELHVPFIAVATDLGAGHEVWLREGDLADAIRASISMPGLLPPIEIGGRWLADGALLDPLPVAACRSLGADLVVAVNLNTDILGRTRAQAASPRVALGFDPSGLMRAQDDLADRGPPESITQGMFGGDRNNPNIFGVMTTSLSIMQDRLTRSRLAGDPPDVHIAPRVGHIGLLEFERAEEAIKEGETAVERARPELMDALEAMGLAI